jgi:glycosyltransferase involved in cell wall biosynthesis
VTEAVRVSVVIPAYNAEPYLGEALESLYAQTHVPQQVIVVDDGSTDGTAEVAARFARVELVQRENGGIGAARNTALGCVREGWVAFLDADDVWPPGSLHVRVTHVLETGTDVVFGAVEQFGQVEPAPPQPGIVAGSGLFRASLFQSVGRFNEDVKVGEFIDWWARAMESGVRFETIEEVVLRRRVHDTNTGIRERDSRVDYTRVLRAALQRRRSE